jgi:hypothetical protein
VLEARAEQRQHAAGLAVEPAPEADHFRVARARLGEPQRRLNRFGTARVELRAIQVARRELGEQFDERRAMLRGEAADVHSRDLPLHRRDVLGVGVPDARDPHARQEVHVAVAVDVVEDGALAALDGELAEQRHALRAGRQVHGLEIEQGLGLGPGDLDAAQCMGHKCFR